MPEHPSARILVLDDHTSGLDLVRSVLNGTEFELTLTSDAEEALRILSQRPVDLVISDVQMPGIDGFEFLERAREIEPDLRVMFMTGYASVEGAVQSLQRGAIHYVAKPFGAAELLGIVREILSSPRREQPLPSPKFEAAVAPIIGRNQKLLEILPLIEDFAEHAITVVIGGETGCGKELVARAIHAAGPRSDGPYVVCNCSAFSESLMESELFGHAEGAFTDADANRAGLFEQAHGGVLFFDEVGDLPLGSQAKLLRVLEKGEVQRVGETRSQRFDVQVIAATNKDLREEAEAGRFRKDLYYRLKVGHIVLPPLRERRDDIPALADAFIGEAAAEYGKPKPEIDPSALALLVAHDWPGNVRELRNVIFRAMLFHGDGPLTVAELPGLPDQLRPVRLRETSIDEVRKEHIRRVLEKLHGNKSDAARVLGISRVTLYREIERYKLNAPVERAASGPRGT